VADREKRNLAGSPTVHIIGAGLSGLSAAVELAAQGVKVAIYDAAIVPGGRCRSYFDPIFDGQIDNGNHIILSGNTATMAFLERIASRHRLSGPPNATFPFFDLSSGLGWRLSANDGVFPWWILVPSRRVPGATLKDHLSLLDLMRPRSGGTIGSNMNCSGAFYDRLLFPFLVSALNTDPPESSFAAAQNLFRKTFFSGGKFFHPLMADDGLSNAFVWPAVSFIERNGGGIHLGQRLRRIAVVADQVIGLEFNEHAVSFPDAVILACPANVAASLLPGLTAPNEFRTIVNAHYNVRPPKGMPMMTGIINGSVHWLFAYPDRLSVTISAADRLNDVPKEQLAKSIWKEVSAIAKLSCEMPSWRIVREKRATHAATPEQEARRPGSATAWGNLYLAGDWTDTGLPATIEGAIHSGTVAGRLLMEKFGKSNDNRRLLSNPSTTA